MTPPRIVVFDLDGYWLPQTIMDGGKDEASGDWGNVIATLNVDTQKAGLWPGGFLKVQTVTSFGDNLARDTGAIVPANLAWMLAALLPAGAPPDHPLVTAGTGRLDSLQSPDGSWPDDESSGNEVHITLTVLYAHSFLDRRT